MTTKRLTLAATALFCLASGGAFADSCWLHNGSLMRLKASGDSRAFYYEDPRPGLARIGVRPGTLLFRGVTTGASYIGEARVFSTECPGEATTYEVRGPVSPSQTQVTLRGSRPIFQGCAPTGRFTTDTLVFTYDSQC